MDLKAGLRLRSVSDTTEVVVVRTPADDVDLRCGGHPMVALDAEAPSGATVEAGFDEGTQVGKRYADENAGLEVLCTKAGQGSLSLGVDPLPVKGAKPLPSSD
jgi:hypothetical protein